MSDIAIRVENLGKSYRIAHNRTQGRYKTLQEDVIGLLKRPFQRGVHTPTTEEFWALKDISFEVKQGEVLGIIGRNGAGKSTLLKILSRITRPTTGYAEMHGRIGSLLEVGTGFHPELTGRENIFLNGAVLGMSRRDIQKRFDEIVAFAEVEKFLDTPVKRYSSGMYMRLAFGVAAHLEPEILVVDEVLAVGDAEFQKKSLGKMSEVAQSGRTVLFVSHNMGAVEALCSRVLYLREGLVEHSGSFSEAISAYLGAVETNFVEFAKQPISWAKIQQINQYLELTVKYDLQMPISVPNLGFVISDAVGIPICGTNPLISGYAFNRSGYTSGYITVEIKSPKLLNGIYRLSLWFGDGVENIFEQKDCLTFEVSNMALVQHKAANIGSVAAVCSWSFEERKLA